MCNFTKGDKIMVIKGANALSSLCAYSSSTSGIEGMLQAIGVSVGLVVFIYLAINILFLVIWENKIIVSKLC